MKYLFLAVLFCTSCSLFEDEPLSEASALPYLRQANNIGGILGFNPSYSEATLDSFELAWEGLKNAGMSIGRSQLDWAELEPSDGEYNTAKFEEILSDLSSDGLQTFLTLAVYDSEGPVLPDFLEGRAMDDAIMIEKFSKLMDWLVPMMASYGGWAIAISNEPGNAYGEDDDLDDQMLVFTEAIRDHIHSIDSKMAVSVALNRGNLQDHKGKLKKLLKLCDFTCWNLYGAGLPGLDQDYDSEDNENHFEEILDFSDRKQVVIHELGMHVDPELNSSEERQRAFFQQFFEFMEREESVRAAYQFTLVDWSDEVIQIFNDLYEDETPQWFVDQFAAILKSLGVINFETGESRTGLQEITKWCEKFKE